MWTLRLNSGAKIIKYGLISSNLLWTVMCLLLIVFGGLLLTKFSFVSSSSFKPIATAILFFASVSMVIGIIGVVGAMRDSTFLIDTYSVIIMTLLLAHMILAISTFASVTPIENQVMNTMEQDFNATEISDEWDELQSVFQCCGWNGTSDYNETIPDSCCTNLQSNVSCTNAAAFSQGCKGELSDILPGCIIRLAVCAIVAAIFLLVIFICSRYLSYSIKDQPLLRGF